MSGKGGKPPPDDCGASPRRRRRAEKEWTRSESNRPQLVCKTGSPPLVHACPDGSRLGVSDSDPHHSHRGSSQPLQRSRSIDGIRTAHSAATKSGVGVAARGPQSRVEPTSAPPAHSYVTSLHRLGSR